ncbi:uncharacterized protein EURHEDRAFT_335459 [Aspergillus ruber CBS 135680]|uniref:Uncharacterized protein n=1 Tax=Aspergillus ruber (strain CBS 135680) TaxID=1388766 RepID=A0A017SJ57_ASPRC|nr:uncharacterized protein EURHEDRAFT_335459 [Aspergillus ruber CBS 135680]EYE96689.1 hypothetical protein EURHEDRAFT_335459 [Aspergillus ruber CBS 135680]
MDAWSFTATKHRYDFRSQVWQIAVQGPRSMHCWLCSGPADIGDAPHCDHRRPIGRIGSPSVNNDRLDDNGFVLVGAGEAQWALHGDAAQIAISGGWHRASPGPKNGTNGPPQLNHLRHDLC